MFSSEFKLLLEHSKLKTQTNNITFLEIAGYPHYENVCSNILKFFFNSREAHNLDNLFIKSLEDIINKKANTQYNFTGLPTITREYLTQKNGRIDILIELDGQIIAIENKIYHALNNDLEDYYETIKNKNNQKVPIGIILSLNNIEHNHANFISITYSELFDSIASNIGGYLIKANHDYLIYLNSFIKTMHNLLGVSMDIEKFNFVRVNYKEIHNIVKSFNEFNNELSSKIDILKNNLQLSKYGKTFDQWKTQENTYPILVHDFTIDNKPMGLNVKLTNNQWEITLFTRKKTKGEPLPVSNISEKFIKYLASQGLTSQYSHDGYKYTYNTFELDTDMENIVLTLENFLSIIKEYK